MNASLNPYQSALEARLTTQLPLGNTITAHIRTAPDGEEAVARLRKLFTRFSPTIARVLMGVPFIIFGLNGFFNFIPPPPTPLPAGAMAFAGALMNTGYMMQLIGLTQLIVGACLVANRFVPLALVLLAPFMVNSIAFHSFLERSGLPMAIVFLVLELYLAWIYRRAYRPMLAARVTQ